MNIQKITLSLVFLLLGCNVILLAQTEEKKTDKKVVIVTKTKDANGEEVVKKVIQEGESVNDEELEKMLNDELNAEGLELKMGENIEKEIEEEITIDENGKKTTTRRIKMMVNDEKVKHQEREVIVKEGQQLEMKNKQSQKKIKLEIEGATDETIDLGDGTELIIKQKAGSKKKTITIIIEEEL
jgi:hypothetical protein